MRRILWMAAVVIMVWQVIGCGVSPQYLNQNGYKYQDRVPQRQGLPAGYVPVIIINPSQLHRHVWLFEGCESVSLVPNYQNGGWVFSRPPFAEYKIPGANSDEWAEELIIALPRNFSFTVFDQPERFWGAPVGQPNTAYRQTGPDPTYQTYWRRAPGGGTGMAGAIIELPWVDAAGPNQLKLHYQLDTRGWSSSLAESLTRALYGR